MRHPPRHRRSLYWTLLLPLPLYLGIACGSENDPNEPDPFSLAGQWVRINSSFGELDGMVVTANEQQTQAVITSTPQNVYMFQAGDLKWRNIVRVAADEYEFEDLVREANTGVMSYVAGVIQVGNDGESLSLSFPSTGTFQEWEIQ